jgi:hypothetical protein
LEQLSFNTTKETQMNASLTLRPIQLPAGGRFRKELKAKRWEIRFAELAKIHDEAMNKRPANWLE